MLSRNNNNNWPKHLSKENILSLLRSFIFYSTILSYYLIVVVVSFSRYSQISKSWMVWIVVVVSISRYIIVFIFRCLKVGWFEFLGLHTLYFRIPNIHPTFTVISKSCMTIRYQIVIQYIQTIQLLDISENISLKLLKMYVKIWLMYFCIFFLLLLIGYQ